MKGRYSPLVQSIEQPDGGIAGLYAWISGPGARNQEVWVALLFTGLIATGGLQGVSLILTGNFAREPNRKALPDQFDRWYGYVNRF